MPGVSPSSRERASRNDHRHRTRTARRRPDPAVPDHPAGAAGRPDRPGRAQRRRQDHHAQGAGRRGPALHRRDRPHQRGRLPPAGPAHRRPQRDRPRPGAVRPRPRRDPRRDAEARDRAGGERRRQAGPPVRPPGGPVRRAGRLRGRGRGRPDLRQPGPARPGPGADHRHPLRRPAPPDRAGPHPVRRLRAERQGHPAARRADQPPRPGLDRLAARLHGAAQGRPRGDQPRRRAARGRGQQGVVPGRQPLGGRHLQRRLEEIPGAARDRRAPASPGAGQRGEEGRRADGAGRQDAGQGDQDGGRAKHGTSRRDGCSAASTRYASRTGSPRCASPARRPAARPR